MRMRLYVLSVLSVLFSLSARASIDFLDLEVSRAQVITGAQSNTISTALQPADVAGWEHGPHLDWALSSSVAGLSNYLASTVSTLSANAVTNHASPTFSGLSLIRYTNAVSMTTFLIDNGEDAPTSVYGLYYYKDASHSTNAAGWSLFYEGIGTRYLTAPAGSSGIYTFLGGALPKFNSSGTGIATGTIRLSQASLPVGYTTTIIDTNGVDGATLKTASVPSTALATAPLYPNGNGSQLTGITVGQVSGAYPSSNPSNFVTSAAIPAGGCTDLATATNAAISGVTVSYMLYPTNAYTLSVSASAPRYCYALNILSTNACTLASGLVLQGTWTVTGTNAVVLVPGTGTLWRVYGRGL